MCQPKSKGGKRCLAHSNVSQFSMRVAKTKTGADHATISSTMKELSREGKNMPDVSPEDAKGYLELKRFATQMDPELSDHERKIQLNQLAKAEQEVKGGVAGSHMYAWKNLLSRVAAKVRRPFIILGLTSSLVLTGCTGGINPSDNNPSSAPNPSQTTISQAYGDTVVRGEVTDELGTYQNTTVDLSKVNIDPSVIDQASLTDQGFSEEDTKSATDYTLKFITEETLDSEALDRDQKGWDEWKANKAPLYVYGPQTDNILNIHEGQDRPSLILADTNNTFPVTIRDGKPRFTNSSTSVSSVSGKVNGSIPYIYITGTSKVDYRVNDDEAVKQLKAINPGASDDQIRQTAPQLFDGAENAYKTTVNWSYSLVKDGSSWRIAGYKNTNDYTFAN